MVKMMAGQDRGGNECSARSQVSKKPTHRFAELKVSRKWESVRLKGV